MTQDFHEPNHKEEQQPRKKSRGEQIFDWAVYGGIAGVGVFIATIPIAFWAKYGSFSKKFESATKWLEKNGLSRSTADQVMITNATMQGGNVMVLPVKWAEDNKTALVTSINDMLGEKTDVAALEAEDKQTWSSIIKARVTAWLTVFTSLQAYGHLVGFEKFRDFEEGFAKQVCKVLKKPTHIGGKETRVFQYGKIGAIDVFATTAASILLYVGSRIFAHLEREKDEPHAHTNGVVKVDVAENALAEPASQKAQEIIRAKTKGESFTAAVNRQHANADSLQLGA